MAGHSSGPWATTDTRLRCLSHVTCLTLIVSAMLPHSLKGTCCADGAVVARAGHLFLTILHPCLFLPPPSPNNLDYLLAVSKNLAHPWHPVYDDDKGGGWKWWECHFVLLNSHISAYATCLARKVCGLVRSTWGTSLGGDKLGARNGILNTKVAHWARAGQTFPQLRVPIVVHPHFAVFPCCIHRSRADAFGYSADGFGYCGLPNKGGGGGI